MLITIELEFPLNVHFPFIYTCVEKFNTFLTTKEFYTKTPWTDTEIENIYIYIEENAFFRSFLKVSTQVFNYWL